MKKRILILDDKETIGKVLMMYLATEYDCTWFDNPLKGLDWMRQGNIPDLIISDIMMPEMRGDELCQKVKNDIDTSHIPVILLTALNTDKNIIDGLQTGADEYVVKPFNIGILRATDTAIWS